MDTLTKKEVLSMPNQSAGYQIINTQRGLEELVAHLYESGTFAFDTEFIPEETYEPELCLIQIATHTRLAVIDPRVIPNLSLFWSAVVDPALRVVVHAASEDLRICNLQTGKLPPRIFDIQLAAGLLGPSYPASLSSLVLRYTGQSVLTGETRTDWRKRPLSPNQIEYALDDVRHLLFIAETLDAKLVEMGRQDWFVDASENLIKEIAKRDDPSRWKRLSGIHTLNRRSLEIARQLYGWRLERAIAMNRPVRQFMRDDLLVGIAKRQPRSRGDLESLRDFNRPNLLKAGGEIMDIIQQSLKVPEAELPTLPDRVEDLSGGSMLLGILTATLAYACFHGKVAQGLVATVGDIKELVRWHLEGRPETEIPALMESWRAEVCGKLMLDVIEGRKALRVTDLSAEVPVTIE